ncbi:hypothetical protein [Halodesulfovibrio marinisediminis]|uniref:Uncharacterized protein n=1 Tax=Halodesulfovibrio marinisediminis DSM 17456 TaxID=1121457 RepID=A0A1N6HYZ5_9BACT|nr:hypothetical protein [Halodesulfovibrio marinisediminis]SIO25042.1 hypothetical protein SAMN02745161_2293 [Halodesulfovibrio marinisediminis DSM 17456]
MLLRFIKKYLGTTIITILFIAVGCILFRLADNIDQFLSMANATATSILSLIAVFGINSWKNEYKNKQRIETAINFADEAYKALAVIKDSTQQLQQCETPSTSSLGHAEKVSVNLKNRLANNIEFIDNISFKRFRYKIHLDTDAYNICCEIPILVRNIKYYANEYVHYTNELINLPKNEDVEGTFINGKSWLDEVEQQRNEYRKEIEKCWQWMSLRRNSIVKTKIETLQERIDKILEANSL